MQSAATIVMDRAPIPVRRKPEIDFRVVRNDDAFWTIQALTDRAKLAASQYFRSRGQSFYGNSIVSDHMTSNDLLYRLRQEGFSILYIGPAGPIEI
ncbi:hypothetical protein [Microvirga sp. 2TAF3]|uniref:hypothetical protein n=1 Tax=Microvirga sp. 2TAF3 TaxID=3233014 RepID=UPI003F999D57